VLGVATAARFYMVSWLGERVTADIRSAVYATWSAKPGILRNHPHRRSAVAPDHRHHADPDRGRHQHLAGAAQYPAVRRRPGHAVRDQRQAVLDHPRPAGAAPVVPIVLYGRRVRKLSRESQDRIADASALAGEILNAMPTVQAFTHERD
jgi:ATP-binding cassette subfamily B protein